MEKDDSEKAISEPDPTEQPVQQAESKDPSNVTETEKGFFARSTRDATFDTGSLESHYAPIEQYEGRHRYDPKFEWTPQEEKRVVRKVSDAECQAAH
jgi:hypothetical protein